VAIAQYIAKWAGRKKSLTNTSLLLVLINALSAVSVTDYRTVFSKIKTVLNKSLDPAISVSSKIFANQTGFDLLDQMVDGTGRPMLAPDPTNEAVKRFKGREVVELSNAQWADTDTNTKTRIAIGDGKQLATYFKRAADELASTNVGGDAWRKNQTEFRYIMRSDAVEVDDDAMVLLSVTLPT
jgi:HK97 family phage major capsid protein